MFLRLTTMFIVVASFSVQSHVPENPGSLDSLYRNKYEKMQQWLDSAQRFGELDSLRAEYDRRISALDSIYTQLKNIYGADRLVESLPSTFELPYPDIKGLELTSAILPEISIPEEFSSISIQDLDTLNANSLLTEGGNRLEQELANREELQYFQEQKGQFGQISADHLYSNEAQAMKANMVGAAKEMVFQYAEKI